MKKILITGGASGLGKAITCYLAENKHNTIYFTFNNSFESAKEIEAKYTNTTSIKVDFENEFELSNFLEYMDEIKPEILINNALVGYRKNHFHKINKDEFLTSFSSNIIPVLSITQKFISIRRKFKSGKIITILTSYLINKPPIGLSEYVANKAYLHSMTKSWAIENFNFNITSNSISPSFMETELTSDTDHRVLESMINQHPNKKLLTIEEVASIVDFILHATTQINGQNFIVNAGNDLI
jgi:3-oxoacyl-[acyl-carrier protein] reductase